MILKLRLVSGNLRLQLWLLRRCCVNMTAEGGGGGVVTHGTRTTAPQHHRTTAAAALSAGNTGHWSDVVTRFRSLHHDAQCAVHITGGSLTGIWYMYCTFFFHFTLEIMQPIFQFLAKLQVVGLHALLSCLILQSFMQKLKKTCKDQIILLLLMIHKTFCRTAGGGAAACKLHRHWGYHRIRAPIT